MSKFVQCPGCREYVEAQRAEEGQKQRCPSCGAAFVLRKKPAKPRDDPEGIQPISPAPSKTIRNEAKNEDDDFPRRRRRRELDESDDDRPRRRPRRRDDDDESIRVSSRRKKPSMVPLFVALGLGIMGLGLGLVCAVMWVSSDSGGADKAAQDIKNDRKDEPANPAELSPQKLATLKRSTVFIKVDGTFKNAGASVSGSGFVTSVVGNEALNVTNHHVVDPKLLVLAANVEEQPFKLMSQRGPKGLPPGPKGPPKLPPGHDSAAPGHAAANCADPAGQSKTHDREAEQRTRHGGFQ